MMDTAGVLVYVSYVEEKLLRNPFAFLGSGLFTYKNSASSTYLQVVPHIFELQHLPYVQRLKT